MLVGKVMNRIFIALTVNLFAVSAYAEIIQIQLHGNVANNTSVTIVWQEFHDNSSCDPPCSLNREKIVIGKITSSQGEGVGVYNLEIPDSATRLCIQPNGTRLNIDTTVLLMNNGRRKMTERGGNVHSDGSSGCSDPYADVNDARVWIVNLL